MKGINTFTLKLIAITTMLIDHVGMMFFPENVLFRVIGRVAFPIFAYTLVEGFLYTKNVWKYLIRLGIFAVISEVPFDLAGEGVFLELGFQNIYFTLAMGLLMLIAITRTSNKWLKYLIAICAMVLCHVLRTDYGALGIITIWIFYWLRNQKAAKFICTGLVMVSDSFMQMFATLAFIPISMHNGKQGPKMKYFFYLFYPLHFVILYLIKMIL